MAFDRYEYQESSWGQRGVQCVRLTASLECVSRLFKKCGSPGIKPMGPHDLLQGWLNLLTLCSGYFVDVNFFQMLIHFCRMSFGNPTKFKAHCEFL
jgi:hypothetical protein